jgi:DNA mismatch endonuclease (patch repair protein)
VIGKPDFAWPKEHVALFIDGCFWHGHLCGKNINPTTNAELWAQKIAGNRLRDRRVTRKLRSAGWSVVRIWECWLKQNPDRCLERLNKRLRASSGRDFLE